MNNLDYPNERPAYPYTQKYLREQANAIHPATWGPRLVAQGFDFVVITLPFNFLGSTFWIRRATTVGDAAEATYSFGIPQEVHYLLWWLVYVAYTCLTSLKWGATPGKRFMNLKVASLGGSSLPRLRLLLRYALIGYSLISFLVVGVSFLVSFNFALFFGPNVIFLPGLVIFFGCILALLDGHKQTLHDKLVRSQVVLADPTRI